jgi:hypothetical protein
MSSAVEALSSRYIGDSVTIVNFGTVSPLIREIRRSVATAASSSRGVATAVRAGNVMVASVASCITTTDRSAGT